MEPNLLEKYWNAETSLQEEALLHEKMSGTDHPEAAYFALMAKARQQQSKLTIADITRSNANHEKKSTATIRPLYRWIASAAAILVFAFASIGLWNYSQQATQSTQQMAETFDDPYEAYEEMREALAFVSSKLNKSQNKAMLNIQKAGEYADMFK